MNRKFVFKSCILKVVFFHRALVFRVIIFKGEGVHIQSSGIHLRTGFWNSSDSSSVKSSVTYMQFSHSKASKIEISPKHSPFSTIRDICHRECKGYGAFTRRKTGYSM